MAIVDMSRRGFAAIVISSILWVYGEPRAALAADPTVEEMLAALRGGRSRGTGGSAVQQQERHADEEQGLLEALRGRTAGSIGPKERANLSILVKEKPSLDIEITFNYNSDAVSSEAMRVLRTLGRALANVELKGNTFLISGHTDAKGGDEFNQNLSERRAETVRRILVKELKISKNALIAVGYGKTQLKNTADPLASENRRVQIINTEQPASAM